MYVAGCVRDAEALLDSVPPWQHSLWASHRRQRRQRREGRKEGGGKEGERRGAGCVYKAECESPQGGKRRGEEKTALWRENCIHLGDRW